MKIVFSSTVQRAYRGIGRPQFLNPSLPGRTPTEDSRRSRDKKSLSDPESASPIGVRAEESAALRNFLEL
ncbi:hypothetical protein SUGI_1128870 [Cryptomeria japonica]|nr:hypothetical protein SUGI_1128870 [Cryptomeria japonica]